MAIMHEHSRNEWVETFDHLTTWFKANVPKLIISALDKTEAILKNFFEVTIPLLLHLPLPPDKVIDEPMKTHFNQFQD